MLSNRLQTIYDQLIPELPLWDLCCDHGQLGLLAYENNKCFPVIFNDIVPHIIEKLSQSHLSGAKFHCAPAEDIFTGGEFGNFVIAGVGHLTTIKILDSLLNFINWESSQIILAPQSFTYELRQYLRTQNLFLFKEILVKEKKRFREILVIKSLGEEIPLWGSFNNPDYHKQLKSYYGHKGITPHN